ncbi:translin-associated factor X-interacting protein 1-like [Portunus trituberculatus]|uniref:translin-associated factor X-interacting protein 1-like n=1 Tax=Portunus trituberculatus TaxID=210409 RepID=UPI001E1CB534|nr:translin-associated factor X-interacting protein 1-like [Portunus trituberculatus]
MMEWIHLGDSTWWISMRGFIHPHGASSHSPTFQTPFTCSYPRAPLTAPPPLVRVGQSATSDPLQLLCSSDHGAGQRERDKPRAVRQLEDELRSALRRSLCFSETMSPPAGMGLDVHSAEGGAALAEALRRLAEVTRPCGDLVALISHGYDHVQNHLDATVRRLHAAETLLGQTDATQRDKEATRRMDIEAVNANLTQRLEESEARSCALVCEIQQLELFPSLTTNSKDIVAGLRIQAQVDAGALRKKIASYMGEGDFVDPKLLQIALKKCSSWSYGVPSLTTRGPEQQDAAAAEMERQYREVVPRADFDRLQRRLASLTNTHRQLSHVHELLKDQHETIVRSQEEILEERDRLSEENHRLRRSATPRPDWNRVAEYVEGGIGRWREVSNGRSSDQLVDVLVSELTGSQLPSSNEFIDCKGTEEGVPAYLRYEGSVRNRRLGKRDLTLLIDDIWREKRRQGDHESMDQFVDMYFKERYHLEEVRAEWCYSLADACQRLAHDEQVGLFWGILCGQVQEQVYHHQVDSVLALHAAVKLADPLDKGLVPRAALEEALRAVFPLKPEEKVKILMEIAGRAASAKDPNLIKYNNLFQQDGMVQGECAGTRTPLGTEVVQQARDEQDAYIQELLQEVGYGAVDVTVRELSRAFTIIDPRIEQKDLDAYLEWVFNVSKENLKTCPPVPLPLLAARLQTGHIVRIGARS